MPRSHHTEQRAPHHAKLVATDSKKASKGRRRSRRRSRRRKRRRTVTPPRARLRAYSLLIALVVLTFSPLLLSDVLWSDYDSVERSPFQSMNHWQQAWTLDNIRHNDPITISTYFLETNIPLPTAAVHRGINILLHIIAAILLLKNMELLKLPGAFSASLIFALHPATIQTIFWAGYRNEIIGLIVILTALYFGSRHRTTGDYIRTIILTAIACLLHPAAFAIPIILVLIILNQKQRLHMHSFNRVLPLVCLCFFLGIWIYSGGANDYGVNALKVSDQLNHAGQNMAYFIRQIFFPVNSGLFDSFGTDKHYTIGALMSMLPFILFVPFFILIAFNIKKKWSRAMLLGLSAYLLFSIYGISRDGQFINGTLAHEDHRLYLALPMMLALVVSASAYLIKHMRRAGKLIWLIGCSMLVLVEFSLSSTFAYTIATPSRMWTMLLERWPDAWEPKAALIDQVNASAPVEAPLLTNSQQIKLLEAILEQRPDLVDRRKQLARAFVTEGQRNNALREYKRILRETHPEDDFLEEAACFFEKFGLKWDAAKARERKTEIP